MGDRGGRDRGGGGVALGRSWGVPVGPTPPAGPIRGVWRASPERGPVPLAPRPERAAHCRPRPDSVLGRVVTNREGDAYFATPTWLRWPRPVPPRRPRPRCRG